MALTKTQIEARIKTETDPDVLKSLKEMLAKAGESKGKADEGNWQPIGAVTQEDWDNVKGKRVPGTYTVECGIGYWLNEKNIAVPITLMDAPFNDENAKILIPVSPEAAFKSKEIIPAIGVDYRIDSDGRVMLNTVVNSDGQDTFPDFAGKQCKVIYKDEGRTYEGADGKKYPSIGITAVLSISAEVEELGV